MALCLGGALTACGSGDGDGYAAVGPVGPEGSSGTPKGVVPPKGGVSMLPLEPGAAPAAGDARPGSGARPPASASPSPLTTAPGTGPSSAPSSSAPDSVSGGTEGSTGSGTAPSTGPSTTPEGPGGPGPDAPKPPGTTPPTTPTTPPTAPPGAKPPAGPAVIVVGTPVRTPTDRRWCEKVTVEFRNTGGRAAVSGTVTFGTHIIGALGIDWATVTTRQPLPAPIAAGAAGTETYTVCVDAWRVPPGMRIETRDIGADWT
ncbi:hypothetical protein FQU76_15855 [Streptomyces qinzhouensis]|uniref:Uncharacterized protein n=2 Tax=Streptomyces qinzhouensis TaxID=2599401 RepID=A0A5B8JGW6_9ACTN|nr:hypothetical protein FQU76_15855 [Streptomyces qinzhouensis]